MAEETYVEQQALAKPTSFNPHKVETWGQYIEVDDVEVTHGELYKKLRSEFNLYKTKGLRCLLKLLDCVVIWAERSQAYYAAGKDWKQEGNLFQGQLLLDTLEDTISEFVSRLGPYQVFQNQEKKREKLRPADYPLWKRTPQNGKKVTSDSASPKKHADAQHLITNGEAAPSPDTCDGRRIPNQRRHRRTMAELAPTKEEPLNY